MSLKTTTLRQTFSSSIHRTPPSSPSSSLRLRTRTPNTRPYSPQSHTHPTSSSLNSSSTSSTGLGLGSTISSSSGSTIASGGSASGLGSTAAGVGAAGAGMAGKKAAPSRHIVWYREIVPAMMPVIGIGTAIFFALQLIQTHLSHSRSLSDAQIRITHLESELAHLQAIQRRQAVSWGDSLGRVIKVVQEVAVGSPKTAGAAVGGEGEAGSKEGDVGGGVKGGSGKYVDQASSTNTPVVASTTMTNASTTTTSTTNKDTPIEPGLETLVDRVKGEFGGEEAEVSKSRWRGWFGGKK